MKWSDEHGKREGDLSDRIVKGKQPEEVAPKLKT